MEGLQVRVQHRMAARKDVAEKGFRCQGCKSGRDMEGLLIRVQLARD